MCLGKGCVLSLLSLFLSVSRAHTHRHTQISIDGGKLHAFAGEERSDSENLRSKTARYCEVTAHNLKELQGRGVALSGLAAQRSLPLVVVVTHGVLQEGQELPSGRLDLQPHQTHLLATPPTTPPPLHVGAGGESTGPRYTPSPRTARMSPSRTSPGATAAATAARSSSHRKKQVITDNNLTNDSTSSSTNRNSRSSPNHSSSGCGGGGGTHRTASRTLSPSLAASSAVRDPGLSEASLSRNSGDEWGPEHTHV